MSQPQATRPFLSAQNIPLWICVILILTLGVVGVTHHAPQARVPPVELAR